MDSTNGGNVVSSRILCCLATLTAAGCAGIVAPEWSRGPGLVLEGNVVPASLVAPDAVTRGTPFLVTVSTFGSGTCTRADGYELIAVLAAAEVKLYDLGAPPGTACTKDLKRFPRSLTLQFDQAGTAELRVIGRGDAGETKAIRKTIVVQQ